MTIEEIMAKTLWHESGQPIGKVAQTYADKIWSKQYDDWEWFLPDTDKEWEDNEGCEHHQKGRQTFFKEVRAILSALKAAGLVIVPVEPTEAMVKSCSHENPSAFKICHSEARSIYHAMIEARPK